MAVVFKSGVRAVFVRRDSVFTEGTDEPPRLDDEVLLRSTRVFLDQLKRRGYQVVPIISHPMIGSPKSGRNLLKQRFARIDPSQIEPVNYVDAIYACLPDSENDSPIEHSDYCIPSGICQPSSMPLNQAMRELNVDLAESWIIADTTGCLMAARQLGIKSILINATPETEKCTCLPDFECSSIASAVDLILHLVPALRSRALSLTKTVGQRRGVILVGGLARSGKSTWAAVLASVLREQGHPTAVIPLDCWLRGEADRPGPSVIDRYDLSAARSFVLNTMAVPGIKTVPRYSRLGRRSIPNGAEIDIPIDATLIVEGVPALADERLRSLSAQMHYVERSENHRLGEMIKDYRWRGWGDDRIFTLLDEREEEELPLVRSTKRFADFICTDLVDYSFSVKA